MSPVLVLVLYFAVVAAAAAAVLTEYRRYALGRLIKAELREQPNNRPDAAMAPELLKARGWD